MTLTIGRTSGLRPTKASPSYDGSSITIQGMYPAASTAALRAVRQQLLGYVNNPDEETVPVIWASDSNLDGYYTVKRMSAEIRTPIGTERTLFFACELEAVVGFANPWFEVLVEEVLRPNSHSITTAAGLIVAYPAGSGNDNEYPAVSPVVGSPTFTATSDGASMAGIGKNAPYGPFSYRFSCPPASFMVGRCRVELSEDGTNWYEAVGRNISARTRWRISNGLVRLTNAPAGGSGTFEIWNDAGSAWESWNITHNVAGSATDWSIGLSANVTPMPTLSVLRSSIEDVVVKVNNGAASATYRLPWLSDHVQCFLSSPSNNRGSANQYGIGFSSTTACTTFGGGIVSTAGSAAGRAVCFGIPDTMTQDLTNGKLYATSTTRSASQFVGGTTMPGGTGTAGALTVRGHYFGAVSWKMKAVPR